MRHQHVENAGSTSQSKRFVSSHTSIQPTRFIDAVRYGRDGIRCNTVIPGMIDTPLLEHRLSRQKGRADFATLRAEAVTRVLLGRRGDAWDVAHAALFLASEEAKYITGTEILVEGGLTARSAWHVVSRSGALVEARRQ